MPLAFPTASIEILIGDARSADSTAAAAGDLLLLLQYVGGNVDTQGLGLIYAAWNVAQIHPQAFQYGEHSPLRHA
jgi:hypothetical protein